MFGCLIAAGLGALAFRLGMRSQEMSSSGKSIGDIAYSLPGEAFDIVKGAAKACGGCVSGLVKGVLSKDGECEKRQEKAECVEIGPAPYGSNEV